MKKILLYGMIALLSVSFLFLGCSTGTSNDSTTVAPSFPPDDDSGSSGTVGGKTAQAQAVAKDLGGIAVGTTVYLSAGGTLNSSQTVTVPAGITLEVPNDYTIEGTLTAGNVSVAAGSTLKRGEKPHQGRRPAAVFRSPRSEAYTVRLCDVAYCLYI